MWSSSSSLFLLAPPYPSRSNLLISKPTKSAAVRSNPQRREREGDGGPISGSDVLRALQRASARKEKMRKRGKEELSSSARSHREENGVVVNHEIENVRPVCVNSEWGDQLDELEKRLRQLSQII